MIHSIKILFKVEENSASEQFVVHIALDRINNIQNCMLSRHIFTKTILAIVQKSMVSLHPIGLITVFDAILTGRQSGQKLQCLYGNPIANNFFQN